MSVPDGRMKFRTHPRRCLLRSRVDAEEKLNADAAEHPARGAAAGVTAGTGAGRSCRDADSLARHPAGTGSAALATWSDRGLRVPRPSVAGGAVHDLLERLIIEEMPQVLDE
jgi:hypothetical protein